MESESDDNLSNRDRKAMTADRLSAALQRLVTGTPVHPENIAARNLFTVSALSRESGVARNAIYTNHRAFIRRLIELSEKSEKGLPTEQQNEDLELRCDRLTTDNANLLKRAMAAERRAQWLEKRCASLLREKDAAARITVHPNCKEVS